VKVVPDTLRSISALLLLLVVLLSLLLVRSLLDMTSKEVNFLVTKVFVFADDFVRKI